MQHIYNAGAFKLFVTIYKFKKYIYSEREATYIKKHF